jgi:hypothetical protein
VKFPPFFRVKNIGIIACALVVLFAVGIAFLETHLVFADSNPCSEQYHTGVSIPSNYGAAFDVFATSGELMLHTVCDNNGNATFSVGVTDTTNTEYVYKNGYQWNGANWLPITFTGTPAPNAPDWLLPNASLTIPTDALRPDGTPNYVVGYSCFFVNGAWQCGCRDSTCATNLWQLQAFVYNAAPPPSAASSGGDTSNSDSGGGSSGGGTVSPGDSIIGSLGDSTSMYGGLLYGNPTYGDTVANTPTKPGQTTCIVVPVRHTGKIASVMNDKRRLGPGQYSDGSSGIYSNGDGGQNYIEIRSVGSDNKPTNTILGTSALNFGVKGPLTDRGAAIGNWDEWGAVPMVSPVSVTAGEKIALCLDNKGSGANWISTNFMIAYERIPLSTGFASGPYWGDTHVWRNDGAGFTDDRTTGNGAWEIRYTDGFADGNPYFFGEGGMNKAVGGNNMAREKFTVIGGSRKVDGIWFRAYYQSGSPSPLLLTLKKSDGTILEQVSVDKSKISYAPNFFTNSFHKVAQDYAGWTHVPFNNGQPITLENGSTYYLEMSAASGSYFVKPEEAMQYGSGQRQSLSVNVWKNSHAQYTSSGQSGWADSWDWTASRSGITTHAKDIVLSLAFTVVQ